MTAEGSGPIRCLQSRYRTRSSSRSTILDNTSKVSMDIEHEQRKRRKRHCSYTNNHDTTELGQTSGVPHEFPGMQGTGASPPLVSGHSKNCTLPSTPSSLPVTTTLSWRGQRWTVQTRTAGESMDLAASTSAPIRFLSTLLALTTASAVDDDTEHWLLGLIIHSYVRSDTRELMHVVILDDGKELHLRSGDVKQINVHQQCQEDVDSEEVADDCNLMLAEGHTSSLEKLHDTGDSIDSMDSALPLTLTSADRDCEEDVDDAWLSWANFGEDNKMSEDATEAPNCTVNGMHEDAGLRTEVNTRDFTKIFADVVADCMPPNTVHSAGVSSTSATVNVEGTTHATLKCPRISVLVHGTPASVNRQGQAVGHRPTPGDESSGHANPAPATKPSTSSAVHGSAEPSAAEPSNSRQPRARRSGQLSAAAARLAFLQAFANKTWTMDQPTFMERPRPYTGPPAGPNFPIHQLPAKASLFGRFWSDRTLSRICGDTNHYASEVNLDSNRPQGGANWWPLQKHELRAFMAVNMLIGIKRLPNHRSYWRRKNEFVYCPSISSIMTCCRYEDITRCLHIADDSVPVLAGNDAEFDKLRKMRWLVSELKHHFRSNWNLNQELTVDETMVPYKGTYCLIRQYMPRKPTKWGVKVWSLADARKKYVYDIQIYTGSQYREALAGGMTIEAKTAHDVVLQLVDGLHGKAHMVCTDNYFTSVKLLMELRSKGTYGVGTVRSNRMGLPNCFREIKALSKERNGTLLWRMHQSGEISLAIFVDRKAVGFLSTYYPPVPAPDELWPTVPRQIEGVLMDLETSPIHKAYSEFMRGVDVADHLRGTYSCQTRSHKWWHKVFFFLLDTTIVNCFIMNKVAAEQLGKNSISHLNFQFDLADELSRPWRLERGAVSQFRLAIPGVHGLVRTRRWRKCRFYLSQTRTILVSPQCGGIFLHAEDCFQRSHYSLRR